MLKLTRGLTVVLASTFCLTTGAEIGAASAPTVSQHIKRPLPVARAASKQVSLNETATLHLVSHQGTKVLHEEGQASGTLRGALTVQINIAYTQATVVFTIHPAGGSVSGQGVESYYVAGRNGHFTGSIAISRGTGRYAHAAASQLHITGLIKRAHYELSLQVSGAARL